VKPGGSRGSIYGLAWGAVVLGDLEWVVLMDVDEDLDVDWD